MSWWAVCTPAWVGAGWMCLRLTLRCLRARSEGKKQAGEDLPPLPDGEERHKRATDLDDEQDDGQDSSSTIMIQLCSMLPVLICVILLCLRLSGENLSLGAVLSPIFAVFGLAFCAICMCTTCVRASVPEPYTDEEAGEGGAGGAGGGAAEGAAENTNTEAGPAIIVMGGPDPSVDSPIVLVPAPPFDLIPGFIPEESKANVSGTSAAPTVIAGPSVIISPPPIPDVNGTSAAPADSKSAEAVTSGASDPPIYQIVFPPSSPQHHAARSEGEGSGEQGEQ